MAASNTGAPPERTIFDRILAREIPATIVHETPAVLAFRDIQPQAKVHVLVIPKKRARSFAEFESWSDGEIGAFFAGVNATTRVLGLTEGGYRIVLNTGRNGCQSVDYVHAHILGGEQLQGGFGR